MSQKSELESRVDQLERELSNLRDGSQISCSRRGAMLTGAGLLSLISVGTVSAQSGDESNENFDCVSDLVGPLSERPEPGDGFFEGKSQYAYRYGTTDSGEVYYIEDGDGEWTTLLTGSSGDIEPKSLYDWAFVDHPDFDSVNDALDDFFKIVLGGNTYGPITVDKMAHLSGIYGETRIDGLETTVQDPMVETVIFENTKPKTSADGAVFNTCVFELISVTCDGGRCKFINNTFIGADDNVVNGNGTLFSACTGLFGFDITLDADNCVVDSCTNVTVTDNGTNNVIGDNT